MYRSLLLLTALTACTDDFQPVDVSTGDGGAVAAWEDARSRTRIDHFAWGPDASTPVADFLFVLDPSSSMHTLVDRVQEAFDRLAVSGAFPDKARIAVLTTTPADPQRLKVPHATVKRFPGVDLLPGFRELVSRESIAAFRTATTPDIAVAYPLEGCSAWFSPGERNAAGVPCLTAHTQIPLVTLHAEAGLTAVAQLLARNLPRPVFRPGASVNVIFVSDTHDPGLPLRHDSAARAALLALTPDAETLRRTLMSTQPVSAVRFHAIAPYTPCGEPWSELGATYLRAAEASGGKTADMCTTTDYTAVVREIAREGGRMQHAVFPLGRPAEEVQDVLFDGTPMKARPRGRSVVEVVDLAPGKSGTVEVTYRFAEPSPRQPPTGPPRTDPTPPTAPQTAPPEGSEAPAPTAEPAPKEEPATRPAPGAKPAPQVKPGQRSRD
jgi:hypothetical protein